MKIVLCLLLFLIFVGCNNGKNTKEFRDYGYNNDYKISFNNKLTLKLRDSLSIQTPPTSPNLYYDSFIYNDSLFFGVKTPNKIDVYNLNSELFIKSIIVPEHKLKGDLQNIYVKSIDSIFATNYFPPTIYHINYDGEIVNKITTDVLTLNIQNERVPLDQVNYRFPFYLSYQKPYILDNKLYSVIEPIGSTKRDGFRSTQRIGIFDLKKSTWIKAICEPKGIMSLDETFYNQDLMNPYFIVVKRKIYLTYPMSHYVYIYDLNGNFIEKKAVSFSEIKYSPIPLTKKELMNKQKSWNFRIETPFYGPLFYHDNLNVFSRIFHEKQDLYQSDGLLNEGDNRSGFVILFDKEFNKIGEFEFKNATLGIGKVTPLGYGLLIARQNKYWKNENDFHQKFLFNIKQDDSYKN